MQQIHSLPVVEPDHEQDGTPTTLPRPSTRLISNRTPCNILCQALYHIINLGFAHVPASPIANLSMINTQALSLKSKNTAME
jgi:hypothetical protein